MFKILLALAFTANLFGAVDAAPAPAASESAPAIFTLSKRVDETRLTFTVRDRHGNPVRGLTPANIRVVHDGLPVPQFTWFREDEDPAVAFTLVLDVSDSMRPLIESEDRVARMFFRDMQPGEKPGEEQANSPELVRFATTTVSVNPPAGFTAPPKTNGQTALYDTLCQIADRWVQQGPTRQQRIVVVLTDGEDNFSHNTLADTIAALQLAEAVVYSVTIHSRRLTYVGDRILQQLASATGGEAYLLRNYRELENTIAAIKRARRAEYQLAFRPPSTGSGFHRLEVKLPQKSWEVRARSGYYVP